MERQLLVFMLFFQLSFTGLYAQVQKFMVVHTAGDGLSSIVSCKQILVRAENDEERKITRQLFKLKQKGYYSAFHVNTNTDSIHIYTGPKLYLASLTITGDSAHLDNSRQGAVGKDINKVRFSLLKEYADNGYPFVAAATPQLQITGDTVYSTIEVIPGPLIVYDSLRLSGKLKLSNRFLQQYLGMHSGAVYSQSKVDDANEKMKALPFVTQFAQPQAVFAPGKAQVYLMADALKANRANGVLGLQSDAESGKLRLSGDVNIGLQNAFGQAESIAIHWQRLMARTQKLRVDFAYPFFFGLPVGPDLHLNIYKRDTLYVQLQSVVALDWLFGKNRHLSVFYENNSARVLSLDTTLVKAQRKLPNLLDYGVDFYGLRYHTSTIPSVLFPRTGFTADVKLSMGMRSIKENNLISSIQNAADGFAFATLYDGLGKKKTELKAELSFSKVSGIAKRWALYNHAAVNVHISDTLLNNNAYYIGGFAGLRGFDEDAFSCSSYFLLSNEIRFEISRESYLYAFSDLSLFVPAANRNIKFAYGQGAGLALSTKIGVFSIAWAVGTLADNPLSFKNSKVHFGYAHYF